jgi:hypothetical protein
MRPAPGPPEHAPPSSSEPAKGPCDTFPPQAACFRQCCTVDCPGRGQPRAPGLSDGCLAAGAGCLAKTGARHGATSSCRALMDPIMRTSVPACLGRGHAGDALGVECALAPPAKGCHLLRLRALPLCLQLLGLQMHRASSSELVSSCMDRRRTQQRRVQQAGGGCSGGLHPPAAAAVCANRGVELRCV